MTNNYEKGIGLIDRLLRESGYSSHNFGKMSEIKVLLCLRTGYYQEASSAYYSFFDSITCGKNDSMFERSCCLFQAYLYLLISIGIVNSPELQPKKLKQGMEKLGRSTDILDVTHYNFINLIEQIVKKNHRKSREYWRALAAPTKVAGIRYKYFYTLISILFEQDFHRLAVERHASKFFKKLQSKPFEGELTISLEEIIPFEELWRIILGFLENKRIKLR